jgi:hypothetical protein
MIKGMYFRRSNYVKGVLLTLLLVLMGTSVPAQQVVDKTVATVSNGLRTELITYSDLLWQLALQPKSSVTSPSTEELNQALQLLVNQRLFALEAERLPREAPGDEEVNAKIAELLRYFPAGDFERRLNQVGFKSVQDSNFQRIIRERVAIEKYLDFRFRSFIVITPEDEAKYYRDVFVPDFRRRFEGLIAPKLEEKRVEINQILTDEKVAADIEAFLDEAKRRTEIVILSEIGSQSPS